MTLASIAASIDGPAPGWDGTGLVVTVRRPGYRLVRAAGYNAEPAVSRGAALTGQGSGPLLSGAGSLLVD